MSLDPEILMYTNNECSNCNNSTDFFYDTINAEVVCKICGLVVGRIRWRTNCYAKEES